MRLRLAFSALVGLLLSAWARDAAGQTPSHRDMIEMEWQRQDQSRLAQIQKPGLVRFAQTEIVWPGASPDGRVRIPAGEPTTIDGSLTDPCWQTGHLIPAPSLDLPEFRLCYGEQRFFVAARAPAASASRFQGEPTGLDASGAVDGVKNGCYGFHTGFEANPWWQVDLGSVRALRKVVVYNRLDYPPGLHNADCFELLCSQDGQQWRSLFDNQGKPFGGATDGQPREIDLANLPESLKQARFLRIQLRSPGPLFFHLDEVEVFAEEDPHRNIALGQPCQQSSLSMWSKGGLKGGSLFEIEGQRVVLKSGDPIIAVVNGTPLGPDQAAFRLEDGILSAEFAFPLAAWPAGFPASFAPAVGEALPIAAGSSWKIVWPDALMGYGKNEMTFKLVASGPLEPAVAVRIEAVVFTPFRPETQRLIEAEFRDETSIPLSFEIAHEGPMALVVEARQGPCEVREARALFVAPVQETLARARKLMEEFSLSEMSELEEVEARAQALEARERDQSPDPQARTDLYREARWLARRVAFQNPILDFEEILFVKRFTQETYPDVCLNHMPWVSRPGGDLCILSLTTPHDAIPVRTLLQGRLGPGHVHGMDLLWDADRIVFGFAKAQNDSPPEGWLDRTASFRLRRETEPIHLFEIQTNGEGLQQLTDGEWSDLDPTVLPSGEIAFVSERCATSLQCNEYDKDETSCNLYVMAPDGSNIRRLSANKDGDYLPHALADGTIGYTRWEYHERGFAQIQSLWFIRPDGTGADALFKQHMNDPWALEDVRSIPGSPKLVAIATGHHTLAAGPLVLIDLRPGVNRPEGIEIVTPGLNPPEGGMAGRTVPQGGVPGHGGFCMTPWPLSEQFFLVSRGFGPETEPKGYGLYLADVYGTWELVYRDPEISSVMPIPLKPRPRPPILPDQTHPEMREATCLVSEAWVGTDGIEPGQARYLRIAQPIAWPYDNALGGQRYEPDAKSVLLNWTPVTVLGTVPLDPDGSAHFQVPADQMVYFQLLDENQMELRRMRSFISFQPGEVRSCFGCHETRDKVVHARKTGKAWARPATPLTQMPWGDKPISFLRDVQPILSAACARCHKGLTPAGGLDFSSGLTSLRNRAFDTILAQGLVARSDALDDAKITPAMSFGSHRSRLVQVLRAVPHQDRVQLKAEDWLALTTWIDANAPYHDAFINKREPIPPYDMPADGALAQEIAEVHQRRCSACHTPGDVSRLDWIDLKDPRETLFLTAPLSREAGGSGFCLGLPYRDTSDPDYSRLLVRILRAVEEAWARPRRDLRAFRDLQSP